MLGNLDFFLFSFLMYVFLCVYVCCSNMKKRTSDVLLCVSLSWKQVFYSFIPSVQLIRSSSIQFVLSSLYCWWNFNTRCKLFIAFEWQIQCFLHSMNLRCCSSNDKEHKKKIYKIKMQIEFRFSFFYLAFFGSKGAKNVSCCKLHDVIYVIWMIRYLLGVSDINGQSKLVGKFIRWYFFLFFSHSLQWPLKRSVIVVWSSTTKRRRPFTMTPQT